jgi:adenylate cyclase
LEISLELERILASRKFRRATSQARFLKYAVEQTIAGQGHLIREQRIAHEGFGRDESFDPLLDPIVRTQALKLRIRLTMYYETGGANDPIRIELVKGSYVPRFRRRDGSNIEVV